MVSCLLTQIENDVLSRGNHRPRELRDGISPPKGPSRRYRLHALSILRIHLRIEGFGQSLSFDNTWKANLVVFICRVEYIHAKRKLLKRNL